MDNENFDVLKALDTGAVSTGEVLIPEVIEEGIRRLIETRSPLWDMIRKPRGEGYAYGWKEQNTLPPASFGAELAALPTANDATYSVATEPYKSMYTRGEVSGQLIAASRTFIDAVQESINNHMLGFIRTIEQKIITADAAVNPLEFNGLNKWITNTVYADTNGDGTGTDQELTLNMLDVLAAHAPASDPTVFIMSQAAWRKLGSLMQPQLRYSTTRVDGGFEVPTYLGIPILALRDTHGTALDDTIYAPNMELVFMPILQDFTFEPLAKVRDSYDYMIRFYLSFIVEGASRNHAKLTGVDFTIS